MSAVDRALALPEVVSLILARSLDEAFSDDQDRENMLEGEKLSLAMKKHMGAFI